MIIRTPLTYLVKDIVGTENNHNHLPNKQIRNKKMNAHSKGIHSEKLSSIIPYIHCDEIQGVQ